MKTKALLIVTAAFILPLSSCSRPLETAPPNSRKVVGPEGSSNRTKSWNTITKDEGDATLGVFGGMNGQR
ncbi:MAG: hypothetical protein R3Y56_11185 [Akkermansia sp.]